MRARGRIARPRPQRPRRRRDIGPRRGQPQVPERGGLGGDPPGADSEAGQDLARGLLVLGQDEELVLDVADGPRAGMIDVQPGQLG
jgi:hypothetical protein